MEDTRVVYEAVIGAQNSGEAAVLLTIIAAEGSVPRHVGSKMLVRADGSFVGTIGGGLMEATAIKTALSALASGEARTESYTLNDLRTGDPGVCGGTVTVFIEPIAAPPLLVVIGGGHVGRALAQLAKWMEFRVILSDDRPEFCNADYAPGLDGYVVCAPADLPAQVKIGPSTYLAAVTRGLPVDIQLIPALLKTDMAYLGLIGSRRRWSITVKALMSEHGLSLEQLERVHAPIGLELQAETPKEIALSIMAEIIMLRRGGSGKPMRWLGQPGEAGGSAQP